MEVEMADSGNMTHPARVLHIHVRIMLGEFIHLDCLVMFFFPRLSITGVHLVATRQPGPCLACEMRLKSTSTFKEISTRGLVNGGVYFTSIIISTLNMHLVYVTGD